MITYVLGLAVYFHKNWDILMFFYLVCYKCCTCFILKRRKIITDQDNVSLVRKQNFRNTSEMCPLITWYFLVTINHLLPPSSYFSVVSCSTEFSQSPNLFSKSQTSYGTQSMHVWSLTFDFLAFDGVRISWRCTNKKWMHTYVQTVKKQFEGYMYKSLDLCLFFWLDE